MRRKELSNKLNFLVKVLISSAILTFLMVLSGKSAHADDTSTGLTTSQTIDIPASSITDTSTVTVQIVQIKIDSAVSNLQTTAQADSTAIIATIQANVSNTDTSTATSIATTQEPIATAVADASNKIQIAEQTIDSATVATQVAQTAIVAVNAQTAVVAIAQSAVDTATVTATNAQITLTTETNKLPDLQTTQATTQSGFYTENSNLGTATSNVQTAQTNLTNAQTDLTNNGTITVTTNGVTASVYNAGGRSPALPASNATPVLTTTVPQIIYNWGSGSVLGGRSDGTIVKFEGTVTVPQDAVAVKYAVYSDDGALLYINNALAINNWKDQGPTWSVYSPTYDVSSNKQQTFVLWYYENGGGAVCTLGWGITKADGTGYFTSPTAPNFGTTTTTQDPVKVAAVNTTQTNLTSAQSAYNAQLTVRDAAYQAWQDAINAVNAQQSVIDAAQVAYDTAQQNLTIAQQNLTIEQQNLTNSQQISQSTLQAANSLANAATTAVVTAVTAMDNAVQVTNDYYAQQAAAAQARADALAAQQAAQAAQAAADKAAADKAAADAAQAKAEADAKAAAETAAKALADQQAADAAKAKAEADAKAAQDAADAKAAQDKADAEAKAAQDAANAKAEADAKAAEQAAADKVAADAKAAADKAAQDAANKDAEQAKADAQKAAANQAAKDAQAKADAAKAEADKLAAQQAADKKASEDKAAVATIGVVPNNPNQLSDTIVKEAPKEILVAHIQQDVKGVENGGIQFFGTKSAPQVVGEDGKLTPPAPPPGSGLPIPAEAITTAATFIGQPGGTTFNAPDIAVPVLMTYVCETITKDGKEIHIDVNGVEHPVEQCTFLPAALNAIPGAGQAVQAVGAAYTALANIGNDMSPVTRKKAKRILIATVVVAVFRRRFGR